MENKEEYPAIIIDNGSGIMKAGIGGEDTPRATFPPLVGRSSSTQAIFGLKQNALYFGDEVVAKMNFLKSTFPIIRGIISNWCDFEALLFHCFNQELRLDQSNYPCLMTEHPLNPKQNRELLTQMVFEQFSVPTFSLFISPLLALYASGRTTGIIMDSGDGITSVVPILDSQEVQLCGTQTIQFAGRDITTQLGIDLNEDMQIIHGKYGVIQDFTKIEQIPTVNYIKEQYEYVSLDYEKELEQFKNDPAKEKQFELPNGQWITIKSSQIKSAECLFRPSLISANVLSLQEIVFKSIFACNSSDRANLCSNIILSGGNTMFYNIEKRLQNELETIFKSQKLENMKVNIVASPNRKYLDWIGGSILSRLSSFKGHSITKQEYEEYGPSIVHRKCYPFSKKSDK